jgi:hypothetical protein
MFFQRSGRRLINLSFPLDDKACSIEIRARHEWETTFLQELRSNCDKTATTSDEYCSKVMAKLDAAIEPNS